MQRRVEGVVEAVRGERPGAQEILVRVGRMSKQDEGQETSALRPALNFLELNGPVQTGDRVLLNTVAVELGLGTGGFDFVLAIQNPSELERPAPGHILKLRYTPLQLPVLAISAPESRYHQQMRDVESLRELPVVCAELHSQVPAVCAAAKWALQQCRPNREPRIVYIMTDSAALPLALSRLVPEMKAAGLIDATITAGQAFGGDYEAVNLYSALSAAHAVLNADVIVVSQGPGNVGTETTLGFSGIDQGVAINAAASLGGIPIAVARISFADARDRHYGLSHHTVTVLSHVARSQTYLPLPRLPHPQRDILEAALDAATIRENHEAIFIEAEIGLAALEATGLAVTTMGRSLSEERPFFLAAAAAGLLAAQFAESRL